MKIILDVTRLLRRRMKGQTLTGIDRVSMAYVLHYQEIAQVLVRFAGHSWVLPRSNSQALFQWIVDPKSTLTARWIIFRGLLACGWHRIKLGDNTTSKAEYTFLINTGHIGGSQSDYEHLVHKRGVKPIFFVHDLIPLTYPEYCAPGEDIRHRNKMNHVLKLATAIVTNSAATRADLQHYARETNQCMPRAEVALLAPGVTAIKLTKNCHSREGGNLFHTGHNTNSERDSRFRGNDNLFNSMTVAPGVGRHETSVSLPSRPYFVVLGTIEPRKNHLLLLHLWRHLYQRMREQTPHLLVIGQRGWECENVLDMLDRCQVLKKVVTEISNCSDSALVHSIQHCNALLFPSFIEGYGLPLVEALSLGAPVIASDLPVFHEVAGDIPDYLDPLDGKRWKEVIIDYAKPHSPLRSAQLERLKTFKAPTWPAHFETVDRLILDLKNVSN